jgi:hypothetical protein
MREPTDEARDDPVDPVDDSTDELEPVGPRFVSADGKTKKLQWTRNEYGSRYFRISLWLQVWTRALQLNPGTTIGDDPNTAETEGNQPAWYGYMGIRRGGTTARGRPVTKRFPRGAWALAASTGSMARPPRNSTDRATSKPARRYDWRRIYTRRPPTISSGRHSPKRSIRSPFPSSSPR